MHLSLLLRYFLLLCMKTDRKQIIGQQNTKKVSDEYLQVCLDNMNIGKCHGSYVCSRSVEL